MLTTKRITLARAAMMLLLAVLGSTGAWAQKKAAGGGTSNKIVVVSDMHVMAPSLLEEGAETKDAWLNYYAGQRKMLQQSAAIFDQFITQMTTLRPKVVLIAGDLTKDGEQLSHEYVRNSLYNLRYYGITVLVIPGNHDFGAEGNNTIFKADGTTVPADVMTIDNFKDYYDGFGYYDSDSEYDPNSLSYVAEPIEGLVVLAIDSHTASISGETLTWLCTKATAARNAGKQVIAMMHHPLFPHITGANLFIDTYTVTKDGGTYEDVRNALIDAGVNVILTGHFHTSDIAKDWNDDEGKAVYDVNTGSLISYPCDYRILTPSQDFMSLSVSTESIVPTGMTAEECKTWLQGRVKSLATQKMNAKAGAMATMFATQIGNIAEFAANLFIVHAEGDENLSEDRAALATAYEGYKADMTYSGLLTAGGITDANIYSILDDKSNYGSEKENQTADRTLSITLPEVGPFIPAEPGVVTVGKAQYTSDVPISASHSWVLSKQLYTAKEINHKGKIWSIAFNTAKGDLTRNLTVYVTQTSSSSTSWNTVTEADCVFSGEVMFTAGQWTTIYFDKPFEYDGKSNIVITVDDNTGKKSGSWGVLSHYIFYGDAGNAFAYDDTKDIDPTSEESIYNASSRNSYGYKNYIKFTFGEYPLPSNFTVSEIGDVSAKIACTLRGGATGWNLRYRKVAGEGEEEQEWTMVNGITESSKLISVLTANTKYEAQVQGVFAEDNLSEWTEPVPFTTACCPLEEQGEIIYALNSNNYRDWYDFAVQFIDVTNEEKPIEVAYLNPVSSGLTGGTLTLCCGHKYKVNWIYDAKHATYNKDYKLALYFEPGDQFYSMAYGEAPSETAELTEFIMDCTPYCAPKPKTFTVTGTTHNTATMTFVSETKTGEVVYSTDENFDPDTATPTSVNFDAVVSNNEFDYNPANSSLTVTGLESLTEYYVRVRSVCTEEEGGVSRWSDPVKVTTGSIYDAPGQVIATGVDSRTERLSWERNGGEKKNNLYYRLRVPGNPVDASSLVTFGNVKATDEQGFEFDEDVTWTSYGYGQNPFSNVLYYPGIPAGSSFSFNASNWNSKGGLVQFLWGFKKSNGKTVQEMMEAFDMECLNDADRAARIKDLQDKIANSTDEEQIAKWNADIEILQALPTDAQKLARMKELQTLITNSTNEADRAKYAAELNNLRAMMSAADHGSNNGFSISRDESSSAPTFRAPSLDDGTYTFFIRHANDDGYLAARDFTLTPVENLNEWIIIPNISATEYTLTGLTPNTEYEVMVEPVYDDGTKGTQSIITIFTTLGEDVDPLDSKFSVSATKKVQFAKGNLRYKGDNYGMEATWTMAPQQYAIFGENNVEGSSPASPRDLFCWSNTDTRYGIYSYYYDPENETQQYFHGDFTDWGTNQKIVAAFGSGWSTLSKDEWTYLLTERENAATLKSFANVAGVQGLILLPDDWADDTPAGTFTAEEWAMLEKDGAVFLPAAGQMTAVYNPETYGATTTYTSGAFYWTGSLATQATEDAIDYGSVLTFNDTEATIADGARRTYFAVRLVKATTPFIRGDANGDGQVTITDAVAVVNYILGNPSANFNKAAANVNGDVDEHGDPNITITDAVGIVNIILNQ